LTGAKTECHARQPRSPFGMRNGTKRGSKCSRAWSACAIFLSTKCAGKTPPLQFPSVRADPQTKRIQRNALKLGTPGLVGPQRHGFSQSSCCDDLVGLERLAARIAGDLVYQ